MTPVHALDLPRDEQGRPIGYAVGKQAALADWQVRAEARAETAMPFGFRKIEHAVMDTADE